MYHNTILNRVREQHLLHSVTLELTYRCNLDCFYCYNDRYQSGRLLSLDQYRVLLNDLARMQTLFLMLTGGEPMVHPYFFEIGNMTRELGFVVSIRTNGHLLGHRICKRLKKEIDPYLVTVSLHGATPEIHDRQTRVAGSFDCLIKNIRTAGKCGLRVEVVTTPTAWNEHQIDAMFECCDELGIPLRFQGPVSPRNNGDSSPLSIQPAKKTWDLIEKRVTERREVKKNETHQNRSAVTDKKKPDEPATCSVGMYGVDIDPFGNVQACMHLKESAGSLHKQSIKEIWNHSPLFLQAQNRSIDAAKQFPDHSPRQFGAPLFCLAVEEYLYKKCKQYHPSI